MECIVKKMTAPEQEEILMKPMVIALNAAIRAGRINLNGKSEDTDSKGFMRTDIDGMPTVINWTDNGYDELRVSVWVDYRPDEVARFRSRYKPDLSPETALPREDRLLFRHFVMICCSCYLERKTGKFIIGTEGNRLFGKYIRDDAPERISDIEDEEPEGYDLFGKVE
ncbi:TPA: hypothetical protein KTG77_004847 [Escherichia coli]|nr:hypothetical protein [Escherichia coli]